MGMAAGIYGKAMGAQQPKAPSGPALNYSGAKTLSLQPGQGLPTAAPSTASPTSSVIAPQATVTPAPSAVTPTVANAVSPQANPTTTQSFINAQMQQFYAMMRGNQLGQFNQAAILNSDQLQMQNQQYNGWGQWGGRGNLIAQ